MNRIRSHLSILFILPLVVALPATAQTGAVKVSIPVKGQFVWPNNSDNPGQILLTDALTGETRILVNNDGPVGQPTWSPQGDGFAYYRGRGGASTIFNVYTEMEQVIESFPGRAGLFDPLGWSTDGTNVLYHNAELGAPGNGTYTLNILDVAMGSLSTIISFDEGEMLTAVPLPPDVTQVTFQNIGQAHPNPVHDEWIALQLQGIDPIKTNDPSNTEGAIFFVFVTVLWNSQTGQMLSLDQLFSNPINTLPLLWHPDGEHLIVPLFDLNQEQDVTAIVHFSDPVGNPALSVIDTSTSQRRVRHWLGAGDLLITSARDRLSNDVIFRIVQIVDGTWNETEFLQFPDENYPVVGLGDWLITATEDEKQTLTCLFDQALSARLEIGSRARVNFTDGTPLRLRDAPWVTGDQLLLIAEGTEFDVLDGPVCQAGFRWWQLQLDDGAVGWAAEADSGDYFIGPVGD